MVTRDQVAQIVKSRRELYLIVEQLIKDDFVVSFDIEAAIENPVTYLSNYFGAKGAQLIGRIGDEAFRIGENFKERVRNGKGD